MRRITYGAAIREGFSHLLTTDADVVVFGQGVWSPWYVGNTMTDLDREFGRDRVVDTPVSEHSVTAMAVGAALSGLRPIVVHPRMDFMLLATDTIINQAANWRPLFGLNVPVVIRGIINRGGEQGAQHSQALQALYAHIPGLKVVMPSTPADARGLLISSVYDGDPVIYIDDRWLYGDLGEVSDQTQAVPIGKAAVSRPGRDVTVVATSWMVPQALLAADTLLARGIDVEVLDLRTIKPWDVDCVLGSVARTGRAIVVDAAWRSFGIAAEISATISEELFGKLDAPVRRVCLPDAPALAPRAYEETYYIRAADVVRAVESLLN